MEIKIGDLVQVIGTSSDITDYVGKFGRVKNISSGSAELDIEYPIYVEFNLGVFEDEEGDTSYESFEEEELRVMK